MLIFFKNKKKKFGKFRSSCKHYHFHETHAVNDNTCNEIDLVTVSCYFFDHLYQIKIDHSSQTFSFGS